MLYYLRTLIIMYSFASRHLLLQIKTEMMHDRMLIQKCTDLKPPNGPKSVPRTTVKKNSPINNTTVFSSPTAGIDHNIINTINNTNSNANYNSANNSIIHNMNSINNINPNATSYSNITPFFASSLNKIIIAGSGHNMSHISCSSSNSNTIVPHTSNIPMNPSNSTSFGPSI